MDAMTFYVGVHQVSDAHRVDYACISLNRLRKRKSAFKPARKGTLFDSGGFMEVSQHGGYRESPEAFAARAASWVRRTPGAMAVVSQDYMCEPFVLAKTGLTVADHQRMTIERYDAILTAWRRMFGRFQVGSPMPVDEAGEWQGPLAPPIMPVLQGWTIDDYLSHLRQYGGRLTPGMRVGVGSVCKRQGSVAVIEDILTAIKEARPDLRLHGFWCEADGAPELGRPPAAEHRGQHGVVLRSSEAGPRRQQHPGGHRLHRTGAGAATGARAVPAVRRMTARQHSTSTGWGNCQRPADGQSPERPK